MGLCERDQQICQSYSNVRVTANDELLRVLDGVNATVNREIQETSDLEQYGIEDFWTLPLSGSGDCEDYALEKRRQLIERGVPAGALHIVVLDILKLVSEGQDSGHAVLAVHTDRGLYILDNLSMKIQTPLTTPGYSYSALQDLRKFETFNPIVGISF